MKIMSIDSRTGTVSYVEVADWQVGEEEAFKIGSRKLAEDSSEVKNERSRLENDWFRGADVRRARRTDLFSN